MKKFFVTDEDGAQFEVKEVDETVEPTVEKVDEEKDAIELTEEEIVALKRLAAVTDKLIDLLSTEEKEHAATSDEEEITDEDCDEDDEKVVDTDEEESKMKKDSKSSFGSIEKRKPKIDDSIEDAVSAAWAKRYGGAN